RKGLRTHPLPRTVLTSSKCDSVATVVLIIVIVAARHWRAGFLLLRQFRDGEVFKLTCNRVEPFISLQLFYLPYNHGAFAARIFCNTTDRLLQRASHYVHSRTNIR